MNDPFQEHGSVDLVERRQQDDFCTYRPLHTYRFGTVQFRLHSLSEQLVAAGRLKEAVKIPLGYSRNDWLAVKVSDFYNILNVLFGAVYESCSPSNPRCRVMAVGSRVECRWRAPQRPHLELSRDLLAHNSREAHASASSATPAQSTFERPSTDPALRESAPAPTRQLSPPIGGGSRGALSGPLHDSADLSALSAGGGGVSSGGRLASTTVTGSPPFSAHSEMDIPPAFVSPLSSIAPLGDTSASTGAAASPRAAAGSGRMAPVALSSPPPRPAVTSKPRRVTATQYGSLTLSWVESLLTDPSVFPDGDEDEVWGGSLSGVPASLCPTSTTPQPSPHSTAGVGAGGAEASAVLSLTTPASSSNPAPSHAVAPPLDPSAPPTATAAPAAPASVATEAHRGAEVDALASGGGCGAHGVDGGDGVENLRGGRVGERGGGGGTAVRGGRGRSGSGRALRGSMSMSREWDAMEELAASVIAQRSKRLVLERGTEGTAVVGSGGAPAGEVVEGPEPRTGRGVACEGPSGDDVDGAEVVAPVSSAAAIEGTLACTAPAPTVDAVGELDSRPTSEAGASPLPFDAQGALEEGVRVEVGRRESGDHSARDTGADVEDVDPDIDAEEGDGETAAAAAAGGGDLVDVAAATERAVVGDVDLVEWVRGAVAVIRDEESRESGSSSKNHSMASREALAACTPATIVDSDGAVATDGARSSSSPGEGVRSISTPSSARARTPPSTAPAPTPTTGTLRSALSGDTLLTRHVFGHSELDTQPHPVLGYRPPHPSPPTAVSDIGASASGGAGSDASAPVVGGGGDEQPPHDPAPLSSKAPFMFGSTSTACLVAYATDAFATASSALPSEVGGGGGGGGGGGIDTGVGDGGLGLSRHDSTDSVQLETSAIVTSLDVAAVARTESSDRLPGTISFESGCGTRGSGSNRSRRSRSVRLMSEASVSRSRGRGLPSHMRARSRSASEGAVLRDIAAVAIPTMSVCGLSAEGEGDRDGDADGDGDGDVEHDQVFAEPTLLFNVPSGSDLPSLGRLSDLGGLRTGSREVAGSYAAGHERRLTITSDRNTSAASVLSGGDSTRALGSRPDGGLCTPLRALRKARGKTLTLVSADDSLNTSSVGALGTLRGGGRAGGFTSMSTRSLLMSQSAVTSSAVDSPLLSQMAHGIYSGLPTIGTAHDRSGGAGDSLPSEVGGRGVYVGGRGPAIGSRGSGDVSLAEHEVSSVFTPAGTGATPSPSCGQDFTSSPTVLGSVSDVALLPGATAGPLPASAVPSSPGDAASPAGSSSPPVVRKGVPLHALRRKRSPTAAQEGAGACGSSSTRGGNAASAGVSPSPSVTPSASTSAISPGRSGPGTLAGSMDGLGAACDGAARGGSTSGRGGRSGPSRGSARGSYVEVLPGVSAATRPDVDFPPWGPTRHAYPSDFPELVSEVFKRMLRVFLHMYIAHQADVVDMGLAAHLNTCPCIFCEDL